MADSTARLPLAAAAPRADRPSRAMVLTAFAALYVIWGSTYLAIRYAVATLPPFAMAGARFVLAGSVLALWGDNLMKFAPVLGSLLAGTAHEAESIAGPRPAQCDELNGRSSR